MKKAKEYYDATPEIQYPDTANPNFTAEENAVKALHESRPRIVTVKK